MNTKKRIGELIEEHVNKQGWNKSVFADKICCQRSNVYKIFDRNDISITQLQLISEVLNHNFFEDLAQNIELVGINDPETKQDLLNEKALAQFQEVIVDVLDDLKLEPILSFGRPNEISKGRPLPDFMNFTDKQYPIAFTLGESFLDKAGDEYKNIMTARAYNNEDGISFNLLTFMPQNEKWIDITIEDKTKEEWKKTLEFALKITNNK